MSELTPELQSELERLRKVEAAFNDLRDFLQISRDQESEVGFDYVQSGRRGDTKKARECGIRLEIYDMVLDVIDRKRAALENK